jgi:hypothetical protein
VHDLSAASLSALEHGGDARGIAALQGLHGAMNRQVYR